MQKRHVAINHHMDRTHRSRNHIDDRWNYSSQSVGSTNERWLLVKIKVLCP